MLTDWLTDMEMIPAGPTALIDAGRLVPTLPTANALDKDKDLFVEVSNAARALANMIRSSARGNITHLAKLRPRVK
jgi:hypothetical protein